jgi:hypothetical protein
VTTEESEELEIWNLSFEVFHTFEAEGMSEWIIWKTGLNTRTTPKTPSSSFSAARESFKGAVKGVIRRIVN